MMYEVRYSELAGGYCVRQMTTGLVVRDSFTKHRQAAFLQAATLSGFYSVSEWKEALKEAREALKEEVG